MALSASTHLSVLDSECMLIFDTSIEWQQAINILAFPVTACYWYMTNVAMV